MDSLGQSRDGNRARSTLAALHHGHPTAVVSQRVVGGRRAGRRPPPGPRLDATSLHEPPSSAADRASRPAMSSSSSMDARTADKATIAWSRGEPQQLTRRLASRSFAELGLDELAKIDRNRNPADERGLAERAPRVVVHRDPGCGIRAGHGSNGGTRCTVVQMCGAAPWQYGVPRCRPPTVAPTVRGPVGGVSRGRPSRSSRSGRS